MEIIAKNTNEPTDKQISAIKNLSKALNRETVYPKSKIEASDIIKQLISDFNISYCHNSKERAKTAFYDNEEYTGYDDFQ